MFSAREQEESCRSIVFALLRLIFSLRFSLLIANFSSSSKSLSTSALFLPPTPRAGASRNRRRWAKEKHTCLFLIYLKSSSLGATGMGGCQAPGWPRGRGLSPEDGPYGRRGLGRVPSSVSFPRARLFGSWTALSPDRDLQASRTPVLHGEDGVVSPWAAGPRSTHCAPRAEPGAVFLCQQHIHHPRGGRGPWSPRLQMGARRRAPKTLAKSA